MQAYHRDVESQPLHPSVGPDTPSLTESQLHGNRIVVRAGQIVQELNSKITELGFLKGAELRVRYDTMHNLLADQSVNITTARERASEAVASYTIDIIKLQGEIDCLQMALTHCDRLLTHYSPVTHKD